MRFLNMDLWIALIVSFVYLPTVLSVLIKPKDCGTAIGCYSDCSGDVCKFVVTWNKNGRNVDFTLNLDISETSGDRYVALGLSNDNSMGDDSVTDCVMNGIKTQLAKSYNGIGDSNRVNLPISEPTRLGLSNVTAYWADGVLTCSYKQTIQPSHDKIKSLTTKWTLFLATGPASNGIKSQHMGIPNISPEKVDFNMNEDISGTARNLVVAIHGFLMVVAWMGLASIGVFVARFYKKSGLPEKQLCSKDRWFAVHRMVMVLVVVLCAAAFVLIFIGVGEWSKMDGHTNWQKAHPYLGCIVTFLALLNPVLAAFRPSPDARNRYIFNWAHWLVGTGAHLIAGLTMILGVTLDKARQQNWVVWIVAAWLIYQLCIVLFMELFRCIADEKGVRYTKMGIKKIRKQDKAKSWIFILHCFIIIGFVVTIGICLLAL